MKRIVFGGFLIAAVAGCATRGEVDGLRSRVTLLESRLAEAQSRNSAAQDTLGTRLDAEDKTIRRDLAMVGARNDALSQRLAILEGRTEEVQTNAGKVNINAARLTNIEERQLEVKDLVGQLDLRLAAMEKVITSGSRSGDGAKPKPLDDEALYKEALTAHNDGKYEDARQRFERIVRDAPESQYVSNAVFWLGEGYYKQKRFGEALKLYSQVIEKYPDSNKRCSAMLKLGITLEEMGEKQKAIPFLAEVKQRCGDKPEAAEAERRLK